MRSEPERNLVEPIEDESVPIGADVRASDCTLMDLIADRGAQVVNEEGFEVVLGFPRREVDKERCSFVAFSLIQGVVQVLDQGVGSHGLARTWLTDNEQASLGGFE